MKIKILSLTIIMLLLALCNSKIFSQSWEKTKPFTLYAVDKDKNVNTVMVGIGTSTPQFPLEVKGKIVTDSMHILNQLKIGTNSMWLGNIGPTTGPDEIKSTIGQISFGGTNSGGTTFTSNIKIAIGFNTPAQNKLDVLGAAVIGASYAGVNTAPANGLLVQGNVGIGLPNPNNTIQVKDLINFTNNTIYSTYLGYQAGCNNLVIE